MKYAARALLCLLLTGAAAAPSQAGEARHVVLVSIDGLMPSSYTQPDALGLAVPNLRRLVQEGAYARGVVGVLPSITYPSHTTLITGVPPRRHGITTNTLFDPEGRSAGGWNWYARAIRVPTLVSAAKAKSLSTASVSWPVSVGIGADYLFAEIWRRGSKHETDLNLLDALGTPGLIDNVARERGKPFPYPLTDAERLDTAVYILKTHRPRLLLLHLLDVDFAEHEHGPGSPEATKAIEDADARLGQLRRALHDAHLEESTLLAVVSDHGFLPVSSALRPNVVLKKAGLLETDASGKISAWRAYFHDNGGSAALFLKDPADTALLETVRSLFAPRLTEEGSGLQAILDAGAIAAAGGSAESPLVLDARAGFTFETTADGEWSAPTTLRGTHGHAPDREALHASLLLAGPAVKRRGDLGIVKMTAIAPTLARFLGVSLVEDADAPLLIGATMAPH
jgi:predicted AlkP superfamily pyrophosphatase or phosphodiesterase